MPRTFLGRIRLRVLLWVVGAPIAAFATISVGPSWLALPLIGVAVCAVAAAVGKAANRLEEPTCWTCGRDLSHEPVCEHGAACPDCGALNPHVAAWREREDDDSARA